jgi:superoxide dismutase, Fe-Mn family
MTDEFQLLKEHCAGTEIATHESQCQVPRQIVRNSSMNPVKSLRASLGYGFGALEPVLSRENVQYHFIQYHRRCYERTAALMRGTKLESLSLDSLIRAAWMQPRYTSLFMLAAEAWNHNLYWRSLRPGGGGAAWGPIGADIERCFGSLTGFLGEAQTRAAAVVGSGWLWVTWRGDRIEIVTTGKTDWPVLHGHVPLLAIDLWEHAYYLDYYNARDAYVSACLTRLIDWGRANERLLEVQGRPIEASQAFAWLAWGAPSATAKMSDSAPKNALPHRHSADIPASR